MRSNRSLSLAIVAAAAAILVVAPLLSGAGGPAARESAAPRDGVVAYYLHTTFRCSTCRKLEVLSREALEAGFAEELGSGRLAFRVVNVEEPGNEHFTQDFQLVTKSLVLVEYRNGAVVRWKNLPKIWQLVRDRDACLRYVQDETRAFLGAS